jgi:hypothetical protein
MWFGLVDRPGPIDSSPDLFVMGLSCSIYAGELNVLAEDEAAFNPG